jgi:hypothetical protein
MFCLFVGSLAVDLIVGLFACLSGEGGGICAHVQHDNVQRADGRGKHDALSFRVAWVAYTVRTRCDTTPCLAGARVACQAAVEEGDVGDGCCSQVQLEDRCSR